MSEITAGDYVVLLPISDLKKVHKDLSDMLTDFVALKLLDMESRASTYNEFNEYDAIKLAELETKKSAVLNLPSFFQETSDIIRKYNERHKELYFGQQDVLQPIVDSYLQIASKYFSLTIHNKTRISDRCVHCGLVLVFNGCSNCGINSPVIDTRVSVKSSAPIDNSENLENFVGAVHKIQGFTNTNIPASLYNDVREELRSMGKPYTRGQLETSTYTEDMLVQTKDTSLKILENALSKTGYSDYYGEMYIIAREIWGWKLPVLSSVEGWLIETYKKIYLYYHLVKGTRSSCINVMSLLYELLRKCNELGMISWVCRKVQFKMVSDTAIQSEYSRMITEMFEHAGMGDIKNSPFSLRK